MRLLPFLLTFMGSLTLAASRLEAGPDEARAYLQAGVAVAAQPAGVANHRVTPAISGTSIGVSASGGVFVTKRLAVEGEVVAGKAVSTPQQFFYNWSEDYIGQSRDVFLVANARWRARPHLEFVGGGGLALSTFAERSIVRTDTFPVTRMTPQPDQVDTARQPTLNGGVAVPFPVSQRIEIVPAFTVRWVKRSLNDLGAYSGVGGYAYQVGGAVRFRLD